MAQDGKKLLETEFVQFHLTEAASWLAGVFTRSLPDSCFMACESPLEAGFVVWWEASRTLFDYQLHLKCQQEVSVGDRVYRFDFTLEPNAGDAGWFKELHRHPARPRIAIELDGHDFHERSREQVIARNTRDRELQRLGWTVLHFSGSEFHQRPECIVYEAYKAGVFRFSDAMVSLFFWTLEDRDDYLCPWLD